jgi:hypothetical protein
VEEQHLHSFDQRLAEFLTRRATPISRRSLLGRGFKILLGVAGISVAGLGAIPRIAEAPGSPSLGPSAGPADQTGLPTGFDPTCSNLHGWTCLGNCAPTAPGATDCLTSDMNIKQAAWVGCCKRTDSPKNQSQYQCYTMKDVVCATRPTNWGSNCVGNTPTGRIWFGGKLGKRAYVCTIPSAVGAVFNTSAQCASNCTPDNYPNTWAC